VVPYILKDRSTFVLKGKAAKENCLTPKDEGATVIRNVGKLLPNDTASHPRRLEFSPERIQIRFYIANFMLSLWLKYEHAA
jgi:hypothetical protein